MPQQTMKQKAALAALDYIKPGMIVGVGTGSTVNYFIEALSIVRHKIEGAIASSRATEILLKEKNIPVIELNTANSIDIYIDGADEINPARQMIKGGGAALTGEKIVASVSKKFICIADETKRVELLGAYPVPIEVIPMARSYVAREIVKLDGDPIYRMGCVTDYGNVILDVHHLKLIDPLAMEKILNQIPGVVTNGIFAARKADVLLLGTETGVEVFE